MKIPIENSFLDGKVYKPQGETKKVPAILFVHGWQSSQSRYTETAVMLSQQGFICVTFDMRGHGETPGDHLNLSRQDFLNNVLAAYDFTSQLDDVDPDNIYLIGSSFGSYLGAILSSLRKIKGMVLRVPSNYPDEGFTEPKVLTSEHPGVMEWRSQPLSYEATRALKAVHDFSGNLLIIESGKDEMVPHPTLQNYVDAVQDKSNLTYVLMKDAPHSLKGKPEFGKELDKMLLNWFSIQK